MKNQPGTMKNQPGTMKNQPGIMKNQPKTTSWLLVSSQKAEKDLSTPDRWRLKRKTQELCEVPARLGLRTPKCIDFATCFGLSRSVFKHQLNEKHANLTKSKHRKVKVENYWLQLVPLAAPLGAWWNSDLLFMIKSAWLDVILTASFICLSRQLWKLPITSIEKSCFSPLCASWQCFHSGESSLSFLKPSECSSPREKAFLALSPSYSVRFPTSRHPWQTILYPIEFFSQSPSFPEEQHMQSPLPQFLFLKGSDLASLLTEFPALSITRTSIPMEIPKSLQAAFIFSVSSPAVGSMIKGAETLSALVWCQVVAFLSFSSLRAAFCQLLARWMSRTPPIVWTV